ncbi:MAG: hypothetical protein WC129_07805 [Sphaerochaetaceae bacterium]|nr:hypothetical protein [Sphaerochaetaceae bacterium]MDX9809958.1 hypothetical protein [Sphaerochaetaceae bacterium]
MKRSLVCLILLVAFSCNLFCAPASLIQSYEPYTEQEFPSWSKTLRRSETIFFGSLPISLTVASLGYSAALALGTPPIAPTTAGETIAMFSIAAGLSLIVALVDYILGEIQ